MHNHTNPYKTTITISTSVWLRKLFITMNAIATLHEIHELFVGSSCLVSSPEPWTVDLAPLTDYVRTRYQRYYLMSLCTYFLLFSVATSLPLSNFRPASASLLVPLIVCLVSYLLRLAPFYFISLSMSRSPVYGLSFLAHLFINVTIMSMPYFWLCQYLCQYLCFVYAFDYISVMLLLTISMPISMSMFTQSSCTSNSFSCADEDGSVIGVFGGFVNRSSTSDHSIYFLDTRTWTWTMSSSNTVRGRSYSACAMTGNQFIVWGGKISLTYYAAITALRVTLSISCALLLAFGPRILLESNINSKQPAIGRGKHASLLTIRAKLGQYLCPSVTRFPWIGLWFVFWLWRLGHWKRRWPFPSKWQVFWSRSCHRSSWCHPCPADHSRRDYGNP